MSIFFNEGKKLQIYSDQSYYQQFCDTSKCKCFFFSSFRYYQIRTALKTAPKVPVKTEVSLPHNSGISLLSTVTRTAVLFGCRSRI